MRVTGRGHIQNRLAQFHALNQTFNGRVLQIIPHAHGLEVHPVVFRVEILMMLILRDARIGPA